MIERLDRRSFILLGTAAGLSAGSARRQSLISLVGYNDMAEMLTALSSAFMKRHPHIRVTTDLPGTRFGPAALADRRANLAPMGARFTPEQRAAFVAATGKEPVGFRVAHASLSPKALSGPNALFVHRSNSLTEIDLEVVARLFTMPGPHQWNEIRSTGALGPQVIALAGLAPATPLALEFRDAVFPSQVFAGGYERFGQSRDVIAFIGSEPTALGFAALNRGNDKVRALAIRRGPSEPAVFPNADALRAGRYALDRHLWIYARQDADGRLESPAGLSRVCALKGRADYRRRRLAWISRAWRRRASHRDREARAMSSSGHNYRACLLAVLLATTPASASVPARLEGSAPSVLVGLVPLWLNGFAASQTAVAVDVPPPFDPPQGSLSPRLEAFLEGRIDFALMSRTLADRDVAQFERSHGYLPLVIPVAGGSWKGFGFVDPIAVIVNSKNPVRGLSFDQLDAIFSMSRRRGHVPIRLWNELGIDGMGRQPIHIVGGASWAAEDTARASVFRERVLLGGTWRNDAEVAASGTEQDVPSRVAADRFAIGFTGLGHLLPGTRAVPLAAQRGGKFVAPTYAAIAAARYPLTRTIDLVVARRPGTCISPELLSFIRYLIGPNGQRAVRAEGHFLPLTRAQSRASWLRASSCR